MEDAGPVPLFRNMEDHRLQTAHGRCINLRAGPRTTGEIQWLPSESEVSSNDENDIGLFPVSCESSLITDRERVASSGFPFGRAVNKLNCIFSLADTVAGRIGYLFLSCFSGCLKYNRSHTGTIPSLNTVNGTPLSRVFCPSKKGGFTLRRTCLSASASPAAYVPGNKPFSAEEHSRIGSERYSDTLSGRVTNWMTYPAG